MNLNINELCRDPLFQINLAIWLAQPQSSEYFYIYPLFYESGLNIYSIGPLLALPPDVRLIVSGKVDCQDGVRPDLIFEMKGEKKFCFLECKSSSFGPESSTASQARTLLLVTGPIISEVLGLGKRGENKGTLCYLVGQDHTEMIETTLGTLEKELKEKTDLDSGDFGFLGVKPVQGISLEYNDKIKNLLNIVKDSPVVVLEYEEDTDPRPLYFIPYDPNIEQSREEQEICRRILFERILSYIISNIGAATIPTTITLTTETLLSSSTFGMYDLWEDSDATKNLRKLVRDYLGNIRNNLKEPLRECISYQSGKGWIFNLKTRETHDELIKQLLKFSPEILDLSKAIQPTLFDE